MATLAVLFQQCSGVSFKNADEQSQWSHECAQNATKCQEKTEIFNSGTSNKKLDFVWVVDNSASMADEVDRVRSNLANFASRLGNYTDLRMALVSAKDGTTNPSNAYQGSPKYFEMPVMPNGVQALQVNNLVRSSDSLAIGAITLCPSAGSPAGRWCSITTETDPSNRKDATGAMIAENYWNESYSKGISKLDTFLRDQSHKVFVFVSDDNAAKIYNTEYPIYRSQFLDAFDSRFPRSTPIVYSIVSPYAKGAAPSGCSIYNKGEEYINLSGETNGKVFDICQSDWTAYFDDMLAGIEVLARSSFPLETVNIVDILSVKIYSRNNPSNKRELAPGEYTLNNRTLAIRDDVVSGYTNFEVEVKILEYVK